MKLFVTLLALGLLAIYSCSPVENEPKNTLESVDVGVESDANIENVRLARHFKGFGGGGYGGGGYGRGGYGGQRGYGGYGGGFPGGYGGGGYPGGGSSSASASAASSSFGR